MAELYAKIAVSDLSYWVDRPFDYSVPPSLRPAALVGTRVSVPFSRGNRRAEGVILSLSETCDCEKTKSIIAVLDEKPVLTQEQLNMAFWMRERFFCTVYEALRAMLPAGMNFSASGKRKIGDKQEEYITLSVPAEQALEYARSKRSRAPLQAAVLELLSAVGEASTADVREMTGASRATVKAVCEAGFAELNFREVFRRPEFKSGEKADIPELDESQQKAFDGLGRLIDGGRARGALLFGVTGSGKTAVYIHLINKVLSSGKTAIMLVPEIALTPQMLQTFSSYFGEEIAVLHSSLSIGERYDEWKRIKSGEARLVIGTRSAIFAPAENIGIIIIDEEQEETYKSENSPRYHARDVAKYRCAKSNALLLMGSATPDIVSRYCAETGQYDFFELPNRFNGMALPEVKIVDMKRELRRGNDTFISSFLKEELQKNIENKEQSILFINRRGTSKLITCVDCGYIFRCPNCSVSLTYHTSSKRLMCHYCGYTARVADRCPDCGGELSFAGDGTEKIEQQLGELFPGVELLRMDTDTVGAAGSHDALIDRFVSEHIPIMIGTQMVTKGLNFEDVTLVGVLSADQSLYCGDYRAAERTFSLITQVVGRSGRAKRPGRAVIQTFTPENQVIKFAAEQDYDAFYRKEIELRRVQKSPPFTQLIAITIMGGTEFQVVKCCKDIKDALESNLRGEPNVKILGPAPYYVVKVSNKFRYKITLACGDSRKVRGLVSQILIHFSTSKEYRGISVYADTNPLD